MDIDERTLEEAIRTVQSRQQANRVALAAVTVTLLLNVGALIWGAATLKATVDFQGRQLVNVATQVARAADQLNDLEIRVRLLEASNRGGGGL